VNSIASFQINVNLEVTSPCKSLPPLLVISRHEMIDADHMFSLMLKQPRGMLERDSSTTSLVLSPMPVKARLFTDYDDDEEMLPSTGPGDSDFDDQDSDEDDCSPCTRYPRIYFSGFNSRSSSTGSLPPANNYYLK